MLFSMPPYFWVIYAGIGIAILVFVICIIIVAYKFYVKSRNRRSGVIIKIEGTPKEQALKSGLVIILSGGLILFFYSFMIMMNSIRYMFETEYGYNLRFLSSLIEFILSLTVFLGFYVDSKYNYAGKGLCLVAGIVGIIGYFIPIGSYTAGYTTIRTYFVYMTDYFGVILSIIITIGSIISLGSKDPFLLYFRIRKFIRKFARAGELGKIMQLLERKFPSNWRRVNIISCDYRAGIGFKRDMGAVDSELRFRVLGGTGLLIMFLFILTMISLMTSYSLFTFYFAIAEFILLATTLLVRAHYIINPPEREDIREKLHRSAIIIGTMLIILIILNITVELISNFYYLYYLYTFFIFYNFPIVISAIALIRYGVLSGKQVFTPLRTPRIKEIMKKTEDLEGFLKEKLGSDWNKIKISFKAFKAGELDDAEFISVAIKNVGHRFIDIFRMEAHDSNLIQDTKRKILHPHNNCPYCGYPVDVLDMFCKHCGKDLSRIN